MSSRLIIVTPSEYDEKVVQNTSGEERQMAEALLACARAGDIEILFDRLTQSYRFRNRKMEGIV